MILQGKSVLVTGGTGFIGGRLVEKLVLEQRANVRVLVRSFVNAASIARFPVEMIGGDINDRAVVQQAVQGCDAVFHCVYDFAGTGEDQARAAIQGTRNVGEAVLRERVPRMVHVSSFSVYAPTSGGDLTESSPWPQVSNAYTLIKRKAERAVLDLHKRQGLPAVVVQPTLVYGPFSQHWTMGPVNNLKTGLVPLVNGGTGLCNAVYIDDVVDAMILAATQPDVLGETFLISAEKPVAWKEFYGAIEGALGIHATVDVTEEELREALRKRRRQAGSISQLVGVARHPEVAPQLLGQPMMQGPLRILKRCLSEQQWESLKVRVLGGGASDHGQNGKSIHIPDESLLALYCSQTRVCIDKAKRRLGYMPQFDLRRGMSVTAEFIHWTNPDTRRTKVGQPVTSRCHS